MAELFIPSGNAPAIGCAFVGSSFEVVCRCGSVLLHTVVFNLILNPAMFVDPKDALTYSA